MPTTFDRDKSEELARRTEYERAKTLACIGNALSLIAICVIIIALTYLLTR